MRAHTHTEETLPEKARRLYSHHNISLDRDHVGRYVLQPRVFSAAEANHERADSISSRVVNKLFLE